MTVFYVTETLPDGRERTIADNLTLAQARKVKGAWALTIRQREDA